MEEEKRAASEISVMDGVVELAAEEEEDVILPGFRFHPTDDELVGFYLRRKVEGRPLSIEIIKQVDIYKYDPWDLPRVSNVGDKEWYFFCLRGRKYRNSIRPNRVTGSGFWKATGIDRPIYGASKNDCVGLKKSLVYYRGSAGKGTKTDWMMHEFRLPPAGGGGKTNNVANNGGTQEGETWTICRIFKRTVFYKRHAQAQSWRDGAPVKQEPAAGGLMIPSGCGAESNSDDEYRQRAGLFGVRQSDNHSVITCYEENLQPNADQWSSSTTQAPSPVSIANDLFFRDSCWDELARVVELSADPFVAYNY